MGTCMMRNKKFTLSHGVSPEATITYDEKNNLFAVMGLEDTQRNQVVKVASPGVGQANRY